MANIIVEGCDCTGKTSFVQEFSRRHPEYAKIKVGASYNYYQGYISNIRLVEHLNAHNNTICDRGILGEAIYSPIKRGYYPEYMRNLERMLSDNNHLLLLTAPEQKVLERFDDQFVTREQIPEILREFNNEYALTNIKNKYYIDTGTINTTQAVDLYESHLRAIHAI